MATVPEDHDFVREFVEELRARAKDPIFCDSAEARVCSRIADQLEAKYAAFLNAEVTTAEAAEITGYDESSIRRWRSDGTISLRRGDLPRKPGHGVEQTPATGAEVPSIADEVLRDIQLAGGRRPPARRRR